VSPPSKAEHGTFARYKKHMREDDPPCRECKAANALYGREYNANTPEAKEKAKLRNRAQRHAYTQLRKAHPHLFAIFYHNELTRLEAESDERANKQAG
jgi:hypothetical protein